MASKKISSSQMAIIALMFLIISGSFVAIFSLWQTNSTLKERKQELIASYIRLADILSGVSHKICDEIHEFNEGIEIEAVVENCKHINEIVIELKTIDYLTEEKRSEYNNTLIEITDYIFRIAKELKDERVASQIRELKQKMDKEMAIVQNKNVKLESSNQYLERELARVKTEKERAISENKVKEQQLYQALQQRDDARQKFAELNRKKLEKRVVPTRAKNEEEKETDIADKKEVIEVEAIEIDANIEKDKIVKNDANVFPIPENNVKLIYDKAAIREQLTNYLMLFSPKRRDRKLHNKVTDYFANPNTKTISIKGNKYEYSPTNYLNRLTIMGPYDIAIKDIDFDLQGKIIRLEVIEVKLKR